MSARAHITVPHSGTLSLIAQAQRDGLSVRMHGSRDPSDVVWAHWCDEGYQHLLSADVVVSTLRDPVECVLSSLTRFRIPSSAEPPEWPEQHRDAWVNAAEHGALVDQWITMDALSAHENRSSDPFGFKARYRRGRMSRVEFSGIYPYADALLAAACYAWGHAGVPFPSRLR